MGEDMVATELVLPAGQKLRPVDIGALAAAGYQEVSVAREPKVAILPTGDELVPVGQRPGAGQIIDSNSLMLARQVEEWGGRARRLQAVPDQKEAIANSVRQASQEHDLVLILAGSSAGSEDFTAQVVSQLGDLLVHGIAVRPGHPVILGVIDREDETAATPVIGVPGYPVSAALTGEIFLEPLLARWLGRAPMESVVREATLSRKVHSSMGDEEYLRVALAQIDGDLIAQPLSRGAGVISSLVRADGLLIIPGGVQGHEAGDKVGVRLYRAESEIERAIMVQGSHDLTLDLMAQFLARGGIRLTSANVGSLGGLIALARGYSHLAGAHLLDSESGGYNVSYVKEYLPNRAIVIVELVEREQGLILPQGNPKGIRGLQDLIRPDVHFVNRQRGAGTRLLLDYHLSEAGIDPQAIGGYQREQYTHMAVAAAVQSGAADCGLGIRAAAAALELDFIQLFHERYDLVIPRRHYESERLTPLLAALQDEAFRSEVDSMPGYSVQSMGRIIAELNSG
ncbi:MAG: molybdopterin biosynthesis protein [Anaerolineales bacterium]